MFFGIIPFALGFGLGNLTAPRYVPSYPYPPLSTLSPLSLSLSRMVLALDITC